MDRPHAPSPKPLAGTLRFAVAVREADLGRGAAPLKALLYAFASAADEDDWTCFPSLVRLAEWSGLADRNVPPNLEKLRGMKLVTVVGTERTPSGQSVKVHRLEVERLEGAFQEAAKD